MDKKLKQRIILAKTRKKQIIQHHAEQHEQEARRILEQEAERVAALTASAATSDPEPAWSARVQEIRDRNTGRKRAAMNKWNRYAGTSDAGSMGR